MNLIEAIEQRHSVRSYLLQPLDDETAEQLNEVIRECNEEGGLHIQLVRNDPSAFSSGLAKYGQFSNVTDYIALIGKKSSDLEEKAGYYGEKIVLAAQRLGLNTCWVALTFRKNPDAYTVSAGEKLVMVIAVGHGAVQGFKAVGPEHLRSHLRVHRCPRQHRRWFICSLHEIISFSLLASPSRLRRLGEGDRFSGGRGLASYAHYTTSPTGMKSIFLTSTIHSATMQAQSKGVLDASG